MPGCSLEGTPTRGTYSLLPGCSWRGHLRGVHIHYCPGVLGGDTCEGYIFITVRVFLEGTPVIEYSPSISSIPRIGLLWIRRIDLVSFVVFGGKVKKGQVVYGVVARAAMQKGRCDGSEVKFDDNAVVLINKQGEPIGTRVFGPVPHELTKKKHVKILSLAQHIA
ncbi:50S ribosomal protein HLP, mitochondrial-like protein [Tanacetum coccineum]|uniref:50S ribosomal protein HLP, mitochondrial-like protein n=1 Tax=Tanacetum coccineum TaxID=301880 RepID=A0ABQ5IIX0_9ASTR